MGVARVAAAYTSVLAVDRIGTRREEHMHLLVQATSKLGCMVPCAAQHRCSLTALTREIWEYRENLAIMHLPLDAGIDVAGVGDQPHALLWITGDNGITRGLAGERAAHGEHYV